jgi:hypothetical protein
MSYPPLPLLCLHQLPPLCSQLCQRISHSKVSPVSQDMTHSLGLSQDITVLVTVIHDKVLTIKKVLHGSQLGIKS